MYTYSQVHRYVCSLWVSFRVYLKMETTGNWKTHKAWLDFDKKNLFSSETRFFEQINLINQGEEEFGGSTHVPKH